MTKKYSKFATAFYANELYNPMQVEWPAGDTTLAGKLMTADTQLLTKLHEIRDELKGLYYQAAKRARHETMVDIDKDRGISRRIRNKVEALMHDLRVVYAKAGLNEPEIEERLETTRANLAEAAQASRAGETSRQVFGFSLN